VGGYAQVQWNTTSVEEDDVAAPGRPAPAELAGSTFETRRVRLVADVRIGGWIRGVVMPDFALGRLQLADAYIDFQAAGPLQFRVGQFKKPFSLMFRTSASQILPIERGVRIRGLEQAIRARAARGGPPVGTLDGTPVLGEEQQMLDALGYLGRDLGVAIHGTFGALAYELGAFNGAGPDRRDENDDKSFAGVLEWHARGGRPLRAGIAASRRETVAETDARPARRLAGLAAELFAEWGAFRQPGPHLQLEAVTGENLATGGRLAAAQAVATWFLPLHGRIEGMEPLARASYGDPDRRRADDEGWLLTPGLNLYFQGRNRLMVNWDIYLPAGSGADAEHALRAQAQLYF